MCSLPLSVLDNGEHRSRFLPRSAQPDGKGHMIYSHRGGSSLRDRYAGFLPGSRTGPVWRSALTGGACAGCGPTRTLSSQHASHASPSVSEASQVQHRSAPTGEHRARAASVVRCSRDVGLRPSHRRNLTSIPPDRLSGTAITSVPRLGTYRSWELRSVQQVWRSSSGRLPGPRRKVFVGRCGVGQGLQVSRCLPS